MKSQSLGGGTFESILRQRAVIGAQILIAGDGGISSQRRIHRIQWPILWTDQGPVHFTRVLELQCGKDRWLRT